MRLEIPPEKKPRQSIIRKKNLKYRSAEEKWHFTGKVNECTAIKRASKNTRLVQELEVNICKMLD